MIKVCLNEYRRKLCKNLLFFNANAKSFMAEGITQGAKEATLKNLLVVLNTKFHVEAVRALTPALENIDDLQRLEQLLLAAVNAESLETFTEKLFD